MYNVVIVERTYLLFLLSTFIQALEKAKEAGRKERMLCKQREQASLTEQLNLDLTYCVSLPTMDIHVHENTCV